MRAGALAIAAVLLAGSATAQDGSLPPLTVSPITAPEAEGWTHDLAARGAVLIADLDAARADADPANAEASMATARATFRDGLDPIIALALTDMQAGLVEQGLEAADFDIRMENYREMLTPERLAEASELVFANTGTGVIYPDDSWKAAWLAVTGMDWKRRPAVASQDFPSAAKAAGQSGWAAVSCSVGEAGVPINCVVDEESQPGLGFGEAALMVIGRARVNRILNAQTERFRITIRFMLAD